VAVSPPPTGEASGPAAHEARDALGRPLCPRCGTPHDVEQEYCLECGLRLPPQARGLIPRLGHWWRGSFGWYPGDWLWPSLLALVIAALAGIGAAAFVSHDQKRSAYVTGTSPVGAPATTTAPFGESTATTTSTTASTQTGTQPAPPNQTKPPPATLKEWPAGRSGWTVVLQSLPATNGKQFALAQARNAVHSGLQDVGIIDSSQFSSLHPGYYVLFTGIYSSFDDANTGSTTARSHGYPRAYPRHITP
jgi:hypothetical protein